MPRTGPRRVPATTKVLQRDSDALDELAEAADVSRSDVVRAAVELVLRGVDRPALVAWLAQRGRESAEPLTQEQFAALAGHARGTATSSGS